MEAVKAVFFRVADKLQSGPVLQAKKTVENRIQSGFIAISGCRCLLFATIVLCAKLHYTTPILTGVGETLPDATKQDQARRLQVFR